MSCPKCGSIHIWRGGYYSARGKKVQRYNCSKCGCFFKARSLDYRRQIPFRIRKKILRLYKTRKTYINKYDNKHKRTYSTREIALIVGVGKSAVHRIINEARRHAC